MSNLAHISDHERFQMQEQPAEERRSIQVEDGYTRTANAIVEAFMRAPLTSREARVIRVIERMTYGWQKAEDWIAASVISEMTGISEGKCSETLNSLIRKKVVTRNGGGRSPVRINKNISEWDFTAQRARVTPKQKSKSDWGKSPQDGVSQPPQVGVTPKERKDSLEPKGSKESSKKSRPKKWGEPIDHEIANWMAEIVDDLPGGAEKRNMDAWANDIRLMRERDNRDIKDIRRLFEWASQDDFWCSNILSPAKFRKQWKTLAIQFNRDRTGANHANRHTTDSRRAEQDRIAASLADPHDTSWAHGLFDEGGAQSDDSGAGEPGFHADGGDFPEDVEAVVFDGRNAATRKAGACVVDGELVIPADTRGARHDD